jgi:hypothetical protein
MQIDAELTGNEPTKRSDGNVQIVQFTIPRKMLSPGQLLALETGMWQTWRLSMDVAQSELSDIDDGQKELSPEALQDQQEEAERPE